MWELCTDIIDFDESEESPPSLQGTQPATELTSVRTLCDWMVIFLSRFQTIFHLPDRVMEILLLFLHTFFLTFGMLSSPVRQLAKVFPCSIHPLKVYTEVSKLQSQKFVVCRKCKNIYTFNQCIERSLSKTCRFCKFPDHPFHNLRKPCGTLLLKTVELSGGRKILYPFLTYCYLGPWHTIQMLLEKQEFVELATHWFGKESTDQLVDVYDGKIWSEFKNFNGHSFLSDPFSFGLMINIDWFLPYKHVISYHVGAIYLVIMNLPRNVCFKRENLLLLGILPGPQEASHDINSYIRPLVDDLLQLWNGLNMVVCGQSTNKLVKCALLCGSCDIPTGRKAFGFVGHGARLGCSRCYKAFPGSVGSMDYSGFNRQTWPKRSRKAHLEAAQHLKHCKSESQCCTLESQFGYRYTAFLDLPYFEPHRMLAVDPMHNLFLGTAKHVLNAIWLERGMVSHDQLGIIQQRVDDIRVPSDIGRIPYKISSGFSSFTADQFKNWVIYYSLISMRGI